MARASRIPRRARRASAAAPAAIEIALLRSNRPPPRSGCGISLGLGGGVTNYVGSEMSNATDVGGAFELRSTIGTRLYFAGEVAFIGSRRNINAANVNGVFGGSPHIFSNGLEGALRVQYPVYAGAWMIEPFAFGGLGWTHYGTDEVVSSSRAGSPIGRCSTRTCWSARAATPPWTTGAPGR
jgi:hypothetical protein